MNEEEKKITFGLVLAAIIIIGTITVLLLFMKETPQQPAGNATTEQIVQRPPAKLRVAYAQIDALMNPTLQWEDADFIFLNNMTELTPDIIAACEESPWSCEPFDGMLLLRKQGSDVCDTFSIADKEFTCTRGMSGIGMRIRGDALELWNANAVDGEMRNIGIEACRMKLHSALQATTITGNCPTIVLIDI